MRPGSSTLRSGLLGVFARPSRVDNLELGHMPRWNTLSCLTKAGRQAGSGQRKQYFGKPARRPPRRSRGFTLVDGWDGCIRP